MTLIKTYQSLLSKAWQSLLKQFVSEIVFCYGRRETFVYLHTQTCDSSESDAYRCHYSVAGATLDHKRVFCMKRVSINDHIWRQVRCLFSKSGVSYETGFKICVIEGATSFTLAAHILNPFPCQTPNCENKHRACRQTWSLIVTLLIRNILGWQQPSRLLAKTCTDGYESQTKHTFSIESLGFSRTCH